VKIIATLCFYDEPPAWLAATVTSAAKFCDHIICCDGAYQLFPGATSKPVSSPMAHEAIVHAAAAAGIAVTLHVPTRPFPNNEVEKRNLMLRLAATVGEPMVDWVFTIDGDEVVISVSDLLRLDLEETEFHVAETMTRESSPNADDAQREAYEAGSRPYRHLMRLLPNLRVVGAHWVYMGDHPDDGTLCLQGISGLHAIEPALDVSHCVLKEHRHAWRAERRQSAATDYYRIRDAVVAERVVPLFMLTESGDLVEVRQ
jgi:hypothetical protein